MLTQEPKQETSFRPLQVGDVHTIDERHEDGSIFKAKHFVNCERYYRNNREVVVTAADLDDFLGERKERNRWC